MAFPEAEDRFSAALRALADLHGEASRFRRSRAEAERALAAGLRIGDDVRRALPRGHAARPSNSDVAALEAIVARLGRVMLEIPASPEVAGLARSLAAGDLAAAATQACRVFAAIELVARPPDFAYATLATRTRRRDGESLLDPEELAGQAQRRIAAGLATEPAATADAETLGGPLVTPEPLVLAPSLESSGTEVAIRTATRDLGAPLLRQAETGDLWVFTARLPGPFVVAAACEADDEWWAASPVPYPDYVERLRDALAGRSIPLVVEEANRPG